LSMFLTLRDRTRRRISEAHNAGKLYQAWLSRAGDYAESSRGLVSHICVWSIEICVVEYVEEFAAQFKLPCFSDGEGLNERRVPQMGSGVIQYPPSGVPEKAQCRLIEAGHIKINVPVRSYITADAGIVAVAPAVGALAVGGAARHVGCRHIIRGAVIHS